MTWVDRAADRRGSDAALEQALAHIASLRGEMDRAPGIPEMRAAFSRFMRSHPMPASVQADAQSFGGVPGEKVARRDGAGRRYALLVHGGGFVMGSPRDYRGLAGAFAALAGMSVYVPDYRLAPEAAAPAQVDDLQEVWRALVNDGLEPASTMVVGDSAGAALAMSLLLRLRDCGEPLPAAAVVISGFFDLSRSSPSFAEVQDDPLLTSEALQGMVQAYAQGRDPAAPDLSPLAADLGGLPPVLLLSGGRELIRDDSRRLAVLLREAGGDAVLREYPEMFHIWPVMWTFLPQAREAIDDIMVFADQHLGRDPA